MQNHFDGFRHHSESVEVSVENGVIVELKAKGECEFPNEYWLPEFVNAHCHLELSNLAGLLPKSIGRVGLPFFDWLAEMRKLVADWTKEDYRASYRAGLDLAKKAGTAVIYDVGNQQVETQTPPSSAANDIKLFAMNEVIKLPLPFPCVPHSIYATPTELVKDSILRCIKAEIVWSIHLAEFDERDKFSDFLKIFENEKGQNGFEGVKNGFVIHGNFLTEKDLTYMSKNNIALVHCPQSHEWFGHKDPDFDMWKRSSVDFCIATDSLASASSLDLLEQIRTLFKRYPNALTLEQAFSSITSTPAKYLGNEGYGKIAVGSFARLQKFNLPKGTHGKNALKEIIANAVCAKR